MVRAIHLQVGFELRYDCPQPVPMILLLNVHHSRVADIVIPDRLTTDPPVPVTAYRDAFGNWCSRLIAPAGQSAPQGQRRCQRPGSVGTGRPQCGAAPIEETSRRNPCIPPGQPLLRHRSPFRSRLAVVRHRRLPGGRVCRRSAITSTTDIAFDYQNARPPAPLARPMKSAPASAGITRISPSPSAAA